MRKIIEIKPSLIARAGYFFLTILMVLIMALIFSPQSIAGELVTYEGTIQGLNCVHYQQKCPEEDLDMYIALEHDFVLLLPDGSHFVLPNLDRGIKARYLTKDVRIRGRQEGTTIWVEQLQIKTGQKYRLVWDLKEQRRIEEAP